MRAYAMRGTPTTVLIDVEGRVRQQVFGAHDDLVLGAQLGLLLAEAEGLSKSGDAARERTQGCTVAGCTPTS